MALPSSCVADTSILIDLWNGGLIRPLLGSISRVLVPDLLVAEFSMDSSQFQAMQAWGLRTEPLTGNELADSMAMAASRTQVSVYDCSTVVLADRERVAVATSSFRHIPDLAASRGVECLGVLRIVDQLVRQAIVSPPDAACALQTMLRTGSYLPAEKCDRRIRRWLGGTQ